MNILKPAVTGVDIPIQKLQTVLYPQIKNLWPVTDATFNMYGRAYRNQLESGYIPEVYTQTGEYKDSYFDDTLAGSCFFGLESTKVTDLDTLANVYLVFMLNLDQIKPGTTRNDEEARIDMERILMNHQYGFLMTGVITGIDQVFKGFDIKGIKFRDMQPFHCFRLNFQLLYNIYDTN